MNLLARLFLAIAVLSVQGFAQSGVVQQRYSANNFGGSWHWEYRLPKKELRSFRKWEVQQLKNWAEGMDIRKVPFESLTIDLTQVGSEITGTCSSTMRFIHKLDGGDFTARLRRGVAQFTMKSSFGGLVTIRLKKLKDVLQWRIVRSESEGEYWFPERAILHRSRLRVGQP